jgi:hypothetical protein
MVDLAGEGGEGVDVEVLVREKKQTTPHHLR